MPYEHQRNARKIWVKWLRENYGVGCDSISYQDCAKYVSEFTNQNLECEDWSKPICAQFLYQASVNKESRSFRKLM